MATTQAKLRCVLLVDDDPATNFLNKRLLTRMEVTEAISICLNGVEALDYLKKSDQHSAEYPTPDLILLDLNMPLMNGWEFLKAYRELPQERREIAIVIMLTTSLRPEDFARAESMPEVHSMMNKPLNKEQVEEILATLFSRE